MIGQGAILGEWQVQWLAHQERVVIMRILRVHSLGSLYSVTGLTLLFIEGDFYGVFLFCVISINM